MCRFSRVATTSSRMVRGWRTISVLLSLVLLSVDPAYSATPVSTPPKPLDPATILAKVKSAVVTVIATNDAGTLQGSGLIMSDDGIVLTASHVVSGARSIVVLLSNGAKRDLKVEGFVSDSAKNDFTLLKVDSIELLIARICKGGIGELPVIRLGDSDKVRQGDRVLTLGAPLGMEASASEGIISAVRQFSDGRKLLQMTAPVSPGSSGGPVLNMRGELIGLASFVLADGQNLNFAIPINVVKPSLKEPRKLLPLGTPTGTGVESKEAQDLYHAGLLMVPTDSEQNTPTGREKLEKALTLFRKAIDKQGCAEAYCGVACCESKLGHLAEAVDRFKESIKFNPGRFEPHYNLGNQYSNLTRYQEAADEYKEAIRLKPSYTLAHFNLGVAYGKLGRHQDAIDAYKEAIRLKPDYDEAYCNLGNAYSSLRRHQEAIESLKEAIRRKPDYALAHYNLGTIYQELGRYQDAVDTFKEAIRLKPNYAEAHHNLAVTYHDLRRHQDAVSSFKEAIRLKPDDALPHLNLGLTYLDMDNRGGALDEYKILKDLDKDLADKLFNSIYP